MTPSAVGERQMLPMQTKRTRAAGIARRIARPDHSLQATCHPFAAELGGHRRDGPQPAVHAVAPRRLRPPLVCLHGFTGTWRTWELVLPMLERHHDVLAPTLVGHAGGPPLEQPLDDRLIADAIERAMDEAGFATAHIVGNSLGGYVALQLAARGRADSVVALAPAGGWAQGDESYKETVAHFATMQEQMKAAAPNAPALLATAEGRRQATQSITTNFEHIPVDLIAHQMLGTASCRGALPMIEYAIREGYTLDAARSPVPCASSGAPTTGSCPGRRRRPAFATTGSPTPTGSSSTASATAPSSTSRSRRRS